jgi:hypothetical protein
MCLYSSPLSNPYLLHLIVSLLVFTFDRSLGPSFTYTHVIMYSYDPVCYINRTVWNVLCLPGNLCDLGQRVLIFLFMMQ